jgi:hypothetical protein
MLDEPTALLAIAHQIELLNLLSDLNAQDRTIIAVLHDDASHLVAMNSGAVVAHGNPVEIVSFDFVSAVFDLSAVIVPDPVTGTPMVVPRARRSTFQYVTVITDISRGSTPFKCLTPLSPDCVALPFSGSEEYQFV